MDKTTNMSLVIKQNYYFNSMTRKNNDTALWITTLKNDMELKSCMSQQNSMKLPMLRRLVDTVFLSWIKEEQFYCEVTAWGWLKSTVRYNRERVGDRTTSTSLFMCIISMLYFVAIASFYVVQDNSYHWGHVLEFFSWWFKKPWSIVYFLTDSSISRCHPSDWQNKLFRASPPTWCGEDCQTGLMLEYRFLNL